MDDLKRRVTQSGLLGGAHRIKVFIFEGGRRAVGKEQSQCDRTAVSDYHSCGENGRPHLEREVELVGAGKDGEAGAIWMVTAKV